MVSGRELGSSLSLDKLSQATAFPGCHDRSFADQKASILSFSPQARRAGRCEMRETPTLANVPTFASQLLVSTPCVSMKSQVTAPHSLFSHR